MLVLDEMELLATRAATRQVSEHLLLRQPPQHRLHGGYLQQDHGPRLAGKGGEWMMEVSLLGTFTFRVSRHFGFRSFSCCTVWIAANSYVIEQQAQIGPAFATS